MEAFVTLIMAGVLIYIGIWLYILLPSRMATDRNRSAVIWVLISIFGSPFLAILLLYALGEDKG